MIPPSGGEALDPFGAGAVREAVLAAWSSFPTRFVEDLHAERDADLAYHDRLLVELAQNASDAAVLDSRSPAGHEQFRPGELLLELETRGVAGPG